MAATALSYCAFVGSWMLALALAETLRSTWTYLSVIFFYGACISIAGIMVPLYLADQFGFVFHEPASRRRLLAGVVLLLTGLSVALSALGAPRVSQPLPSLEVTLRYLLLLVPIGLGLCVQTFFLVPRSIEAVLQGKPIATAAATVVSAVAFSLGCGAGGLLTDPAHIAPIVALSLPLAAGAVLTRSVYVTFPAVFVMLSTNSLSAGHQSDEPLGALLTGFVIFAAALAYALLSREPRHVLLQ